MERRAANGIERIAGREKRAVNSRAGAASAIKAYGFLQVKFAASCESPEPLYAAYCG
jgi:hypothetical protein